MMQADDAAFGQPQPPAPPAPIASQPIPPNDPSLFTEENLLPYSLYDVVLDLPYPGSSSTAPIEVIYPPNDVGYGTVDIIPSDQLHSEFGPEDGAGGQGAAKIARFTFPEYEDRANAQEASQRQAFLSRFPPGEYNGPSLNRHDAYLEEVSSPPTVNANNSGVGLSASGGGAPNNNATDGNNIPSKSLPSHHVFSHRLANGTIIHGHVRRYLPYHSQAGGRRDVGRRGLRALVLLTRNAGGGDRLYSAILKSLEVLTLQSEALSQNVNAKGDTVTNAPSGLTYRRWFLHTAFQEHVNLCRVVGASMEGGVTGQLTKPRILTLSLVEVGRGHGLFGAVDTMKLAVPPFLVHGREPSGNEASASVAGLSRNDMLPMLRCLGAAKTMRLLSALMSEKRVILTSANVSKLSAVAYGAVAMTGQGLLPPPPVFVPVLAPGLASLLQTPSAYLVGVLTGTTPNFINLRSIVPTVGEVVIFDLDNAGNEPYFVGIVDPLRAVPDFTRRSFDDDSRVSLPDVLYQDLTEVMKLDKKMLFWQGAVQEKLGMVADKSKTAAKAAMKKGLKYLKGKSSKKTDGREVEEDDDLEEEVVEQSDNSMSKLVGKGNYSYEAGFSNAVAEVEARIAFAVFFVSIFGDLRAYLTQQTPGAPPTVDKEKFMKYRAANGDVPGTQMFAIMSNFLRSSLFDQFVEARMKEVQMRRVVPEDAPLFSLTTNFHRSNKIDFYVNNVRNTVRQIATNPNLPGRYLIPWNEGIRRRVLELTSTQAFNGDPRRALTLLTEDCHESSTILIDTIMILWTRIQEGKGMQWKKALLALQVFRDLLLNGPINAVAEAIDGFASIRILRSYTDAMRGQNSALVRAVATEIYNLVVDLPVLFARRRECMNNRRLEKDPKPSPLRKETRMIKGIAQFRNMHIALCPAGASVAPAPPAVNDLLGHETVSDGVGSVGSVTVPQVEAYSADLLSLSVGDNSATASTTSQKLPNPFDMDAMSRSIPVAETAKAVEQWQPNFPMAPPPFQPTQQQQTPRQSLTTVPSHMISSAPPPFPPIQTVPPTQQMPPQQQFQPQPMVQMPPAVLSTIPPPAPNSFNQPPQQMSQGIHPANQQQQWSSAPSTVMQRGPSSQMQMPGVAQPPNGYLTMQGMPPQIQLQPNPYPQHKGGVYTQPNGQGQPNAQGVMQQQQPGQQQQQPPRPAMKFDPMA